MRKLMRSALVAAASAAAVVAGTTAPPVAAAAPAGTGFGGAYGWGHNGNGFPGPGAVGDGTNINRPTPVPLSALPDNVKQVSRGYLYGLAVLTSGSLYAWGYNGHGVLGTGTQPDGTTVSTNVRSRCRCLPGSPRSAPDGSTFSQWTTTAACGPGALIPMESWVMARSRPSSPRSGSRPATDRPGGGGHPAQPGAGR